MHYPCKLFTFYAKQTFNLKHDLKYSIRKIFIKKYTRSAHHDLVPPFNFGK